MEMELVGKLGLVGGVGVEVCKWIRASTKEI